MQSRCESRMSVSEPCDTHTHTHTHTPIRVFRVLIWLKKSIGQQIRKLDWWSKYSYCTRFVGQCAKSGGQEESLSMLSLSRALSPRSVKFRSGSGRQLAVTSQSCIALWISTTRHRGPHTDHTTRSQVDAYSRLAWRWSSADKLPSCTQALRSAGSSRSCPHAPQRYCPASFQFGENVTPFW